MNSLPDVLCVCTEVQGLSFDSAKQFLEQVAYVLEDK